MAEPAAPRDEAVADASDDAADSEFTAAFAEASEAATDAEPSPEPPAPKAGAGDEEGGKATKAASQETEEGAADAAPDPWKDAPEPLRAWKTDAEKELDSLRQYKRSNTGREAARMRRIAELEEQVKASNEKAAAAPTAAAADDPDIAKFEDEYPDIPLRKLVTKVTADKDTRIADLEKKIAALEGRAHVQDTTAHVQEQEATLQETHPDWREMTGAEGAKLDAATLKKNSDAFVDWIQAQPDSVQEIAVRNGEAIVNAREAAFLISSYKAHLAAAKAAGATDPDPASETPPSPPRDPKRAKQLAAAQTVPHRGPAPAGAAPDDFSAAFAQAAKEIEREAQRA